LDHRDRLTQENCDLLPTFQRVWPLHIGIS
jgi:hypothetical protein